LEFNEILGGFRKRADEVFALLRSPEVAFVLVASPEPLAIDEAIYFSERLRSSAMTPGAFVVNRVREARGPAPALDEGPARIGARPQLRDLAPEEIARAARALRDNYEQFEALASADAGELARLRARCGPQPTYVEVPFFASDVHDMEGLARIEHA